jgi:alpha,alpha-trehalase
LYFQWDYPCIWPSNVWFGYQALKNVGLIEDAERVAKKYMLGVNINFEKTGVLWEKYDGRDGSVAITNEYHTPEMLGWSAGVYRYFVEDMKL